MIITLCGSTRFINEFNDANIWLTMNGHIVLSVGSFHHSDRDIAIRDIIIEHKHILDKLHFQKIDMSHAIMVIDVNDYIGDSTKNEIRHAKSRHIPIYSYRHSKSINSRLKHLETHLGGLFNDI